MNLLYIVKLLIRKIRKTWRGILRYPIKKVRSQSVENKTGVTIFSSNCLGGLIYNTLGMRFDTPTINMFMMTGDFLRFLKEYHAYIEAERFELQEMGKYPIVRCYKKNSEEYITLFCSHYKSVEEVAEKWMERSKRVTENIRVIMVQRDGCTDKDLKEFDKIPFKDKVCFTGKPYPQYKWAVCVKSDKQKPNSGEVMDLTQYINWHTGKRYIDYFDYVNFVKGGAIESDSDITI